jgi:hypothetical protein
MKLSMDTGSASRAFVAMVWNVWHNLALAVQDQVELPDGCELQWKLTHQPLVGGEEFRGMVSVTFPVQIDYEQAGGLHKKADVPIICVDGIEFFHDGGVRWLSEGSETAALIATALTKGEVRGRHFVCNMSPQIVR